MKKRVFLLLLAAMMMPFAMNAQVKSFVHVDNTVNACDSYTWSANGMTYTTSGARTYISGDTLYILDLTIYPTYTTIISTPVQGGCTYTWGDSTYSTEGEHTQTFQSVNGCDSNVTITLVLTGTASRNYTVTACESYIWKGDTLTSTGINMMTDTSNANCDSLLTLNLTIIAPTQIDFDTTVSACGSIRWRFLDTQSNERIREDGAVRTSVGIDTTDEGRAVFHPRTIERCFDSTITVHFNIKSASLTRLTERACGTYTFTVNDTTDKVYTHSIKDSIIYTKGAANGCDSIVVLNLTINSDPVITISGDLRVAPGSNATLYGSADQNVAFKWSNGSTADSIVLTNVQGNTDVSLYGKNNSTGCDNTTYVTVMANLAVENVEDGIMKVYPNPTSAIINITSNETVKSVSVYNTNGQRVMSLGSVNSVDMRTLANGTYIVRVEMENGNVATRNIVLFK